MPPLPWGVHLATRAGVSAVVPTVVSVVTIVTKAIWVVGVDPTGILTRKNMYFNYFISCLVNYLLLKKLVCIITFKYFICILFWCIVFECLNAHKRDPEVIIFN